MTPLPSAESPHPTAALPDTCLPTLSLSPHTPWALVPRAKSCYFPTLPGPIHHPWTTLSLI